MKKAVLWDFGGVILSSPFEAFNRYEAEHGLPPDFLRSVNATNPHDNAWARLERGEIEPTEFDRQFADESATLGHRVPGADVLALLHGAIRPEMVALLDRVKAAGYKVACLTNNVVSSESSAALTSPERATEIADVMARFDDIIESSKVGVRKPERRFYEIACARLGVMPEDCVFLDDLGVNLKPAAQMGMTTIKVTSAQQAIDELVEVLGLRADQLIPKPPVDEHLNAIDEQMGARGTRIGVIGTIVVIGAMVLFGQRLLQQAIVAVSRSRERPSWPIEMLYYVLSFDLGLMLIWMLFLPIVGHLRDRRLRSVRAGTLWRRLPRWVLRVVVATMLQYVTAIVVFGSLRIGLGIAGAAVGAAALSMIGNLQGRWFFSLYAPLRPLPSGPLDDEISSLASRTKAGVFRRYFVSEQAVGTRLNAGVLFDNAKPAMLVWDTATEMPADERRMMLAHELGHMVHRDVRKLTILFSVMMAASTVVGLQFAKDVNLFENLDLSTLPVDDPRLYFSYRLISLYAVIPLGFATAGFRRGTERAADNFALDLERDPAAFRRLMVTLVRANRSPVSRAFGGAGCSHPPVRQRLQFAVDWQRRNWELR